MGTLRILPALLLVSVLQVAAPAPDSSQGSSRAGLSAAAAAAAKLARARNRKAAVASGALTNTVQAALRALQVGAGSCRIVRHGLGFFFQMG